MLYTPETFPFEKRYWYNHMKPFDREIWERFLIAYPKAWDYVQYSVPCGSSAPFDTLVTEESGAHDEYNYKRKIDVIGFKGDEVSIIELKPNAGSSAIGQVKMYRDLYFADYSPPRLPDMVIITDKIDPDVRKFARREGVKIIVI